MFQSLPDVPPDPIFSLLEQFRADPNPARINLTVGAWQDEQGRTPVMQCVKQAETRILESEQTKNYLGIGGSAEYNQATARLLLGEEAAALGQNRYTTIQTPGGTGALRVAAEYLARLRSESRLWIGHPTWANHANIFSQANVRTRQYEYLESSRRAVDFESLVTALAEATEGDAFLFHTCCHNPSGFDLEIDQWEIVFGFVRERNLLAVFDCAYQGFRESLDSDVWPLRRLAELDAEFLICSSNSKNLGLYGERVGALTGVCQSSDAAKKLDACLRSLVRAIYSNPPRHGGLIAAAILDDPQWRSLWIDELAMVRGRIIEMRRLLAEKLAACCGGDAFGFMKDQHGMFSYTGLSADQADRLREQHSIYMLRSGRINVAGVTPANVDTICAAIASVV